MMTNGMRVFQRGSGFAHAVLDKSNDFILGDDFLIIILTSRHHSVNDRNNARVRRHARCYKLVEATEHLSMTEDHHTDFFVVR